MVYNTSHSLAARIGCIGTQPVPVRQKRDAFLAARGQIEILVLLGIQSASRLAHGRYQAALVSDIPRKNELAPIAQQELIETVEALKQTLPAFATTLDQCSCLTVSQASPLAVAQIAFELDEATHRLTSVKKLLADWKTALADYARATELKTRKPNAVTQQPLEPLDPPDLT
ncbi:MAG: hypothetical protein SGJ27_12295 [Candidatus Melainabacteria bacterium]|nr:hypothetical protein [Candidatus Melainabacteria bacterium]